MRALSHDRFGGPEVLAVHDWPRPEPGPHEVRVRVRAAALNPKDAFLRKGRFRWLARAPLPRLVGHDFAGEIDACGRDVAGYSAGDRVFGFLPWSGRRGTLAEHVVARVGTFAKMGSLSFVDAAAMPIAAQTALQALRDLACVTRDDDVLVNGASGGVGTYAVQIAKHLGAHVTTASSEANLALCRSLGADATLDYRKDDVLGGRHRVVFDVMGNLGFAKASRALVPGGVYVSTVPSAGILVDEARTRLSPFAGTKRAALVVVRSREADLATLARWAEEGALRSVVDATFALDEHAAAFARLESRRARGKIVITIA